MTKGAASDFAKILKSIMETETPPEESPPHRVDWLVQEGYVEEHGNRKFHITEAGALLYSECFIRLLNTRREN